MGKSESKEQATLVPVEPVALTGKGGSVVEIVEAEVFGDLAVHRNLKSTELWTVTHIASGRAVKLDCPTRGRAIRLAEELEKLDWSGEIDEFCERNKAKVGEVIRRIVGR